ncbi:fungal-specific transcription factor domain-containing protein [Xylaria sp. FL1042]|nr:fungal-specific transcription factor domain-containing protein [Xylaria sp. FL1042]
MIGYRGCGGYHGYHGHDGTAFKTTLSFLPPSGSCRIVLSDPCRSKVGRLLLFAVAFNLKHPPHPPHQPAWAEKTVSLETMLKRKRISVACNSCRAKKVKCDGRQPVCERCAGYSYRCTWPAVSRGQYSGLSPQVPPPALSVAGPADGKTVQDTLAKYQDWVCSACIHLPEDTMNEIRAGFDFIRSHVSTQTDDHTDAPALEDDGLPAQQPRSRGYLGETSDVRFVNFVRKVVSSDGNGNVNGNGDGDGDGSSSDAHEPPAEDPENYDSEQLFSHRRLTNPLSCIPSRDVILECLGSYFSTIHIAYPFVGKHGFLSKLETLLATGFDDRLPQPWLSLLYSLLALGAYYQSFRAQGSQTDGISHQSLFQRSVMLSELNTSERSVTQVSALLAQSFYLLATSKIERCWRQLGIAIRLAQSIGLHVNMDDLRSDYTHHTSAEVRDAEMVSRVWYSLYVLDRLLALQLGRPPAIADQDCHVSIPDRIQELEDQFNDNDSDALRRSDGGKCSCASQYFISMIEFSTIIGRILRESYHPRRDLVARVDTVARHNKMLLNWKNKLPRHLRFDLGHAFDKSEILKRQRNMLAIKFHHIQTLIHRPYLCYPHLLRKGHHDSQQQQSALSQDQLGQIRQYGRTCEDEATAIIRLLQNVGDAEEVVMNYPWWQMISCLVCAGSVLVVALAYAKRKHGRNGSSSADDADRGADDCDEMREGSGADHVTTALAEHVETCLRILNRLGPRSHGARRAWSMIKSMREQSSCLSSPVKPLVPSTSVSLDVSMPLDARPVAGEIAGGNGNSDDFVGFQPIFGDDFDLGLYLQPSATSQMEWPDNGFLGGWL